MKTLLATAAALAAVAVPALADGPTLQDLVPRYEITPDRQPQLPTTAPSPAPTDYQRFDNWVQERRNADGLGVGIDTNTGAPTVTWKDSFQ